MRAILVLNAGSSSIKFGLYNAEDVTSLVRGKIEALTSTPKYTVSGHLAPELSALAPLPDPATHATVIAWLLHAIRSHLSAVELMGAGHRVVHGGPTYEAPARVNDAVLSDLEKLIALAPGHEPHNIAAIRAVATTWPTLSQVACFDTQFHRNQPRTAQLFGLPHHLASEGILRYGFHGLSYEYIASALPQSVGAKADERVVVAHLGNGASMCAMLKRKSIASTMGFTALDGLMMGTRCGRLDPGVVLHLIQQGGLTAAEVSDILYNQSGLLGVSGISSDVRDLEKTQDPRATEALDLFAYRAVSELGALVALLKGLDVLVFTAGIGQHSPGIRQRICDHLEWLGITIDPVANAANKETISASTSKVDVLVMPTDEEIVIAKATARFLDQKSPRQ
ncbi:MAG: acetate/propionate family kinase [Pseudomonadota bacterium]